MLGIKTENLGSEDRKVLDKILGRDGIGILNRCGYVPALAILQELETAGFPVTFTDRWLPEWYLQAGFDSADCYRHGTVIPECLAMEHGGRGSEVEAFYTPVLDGLRTYYIELTERGAGRDAVIRADIAKRGAFYTPLTAHMERMRTKFIQKCYSMDKYVVLRMEIDYKWKKLEEKEILDPLLGTDLRMLVELVAKEYDVLKLNYILNGGDEELNRVGIMKKYEKRIAKAESA